MRRRATYPDVHNEGADNGRRNMHSLLFIVLSVLNFLFLRWLWRMANAHAHDDRSRTASADEQRTQEQEQVAFDEIDNRSRIQPDISPHVYFVTEEGHEALDVNVRAIAIFAIALVVLAVILHVALWFLLDLFADDPLRPGLETQPFAESTQLPPPEPRLQEAPEHDLDEYVATEEAMLNSYEWLDREGGVARIPIDQAKRLLVEGGFPLRASPEPAGAATATPQAEAQPQAAAIAAGEELFQSSGCIGCHQMDGSGTGPSLVGVFGSQVPLESEETVLADEAYIRRSILRPQEQVVAGYDPVMPSFAGELNDEEVAQLVAYIRSLSEEANQQ